MRTLSAVLFLFFISCSSPEDKAKDLIKTHLSKTMKDYSSYEPVEFGKLDTLLTSAKDDPEYQFLDKWQKSLHDSASTLQIQAVEEENKGNQKRADSMRFVVDQFDTRSDSLHKVILQMIEDHKGTFKGWRIYHSYRGKNSYGAKVLSGYWFMFNPSMDSLIDTYQLK